MSNFEQEYESLSAASREDTECATKMMGDIWNQLFNKEQVGRAIGSLAKHGIGAVTHETEHSQPNELLGPLFIEPTSECTIATATNVQLTPETTATSAIGKVAQQVSPEAPEKALNAVSAAMANGIEAIGQALNAPENLYQLWQKRAAEPSGESNGTPLTKLLREVESSNHALTYALKAAGNFIAPDVAIRALSSAISERSLAHDAPMPELPPNAIAGLLNPGAISNVGTEVRASEISIDDLLHRANGDALNAIAGKVKLARFADLFAPLSGSKSAIESIGKHLQSGSALGGVAENLNSAPVLDALRKLMESAGQLKDDSDMKPDRYQA